MKNIKNIIKKALQDQRIENFNDNHYDFIDRDEMTINHKGLKGHLLLEYHSINIDNYKIVIFSN